MKYDKVIKNELWAIIKKSLIDYIAPDIPIKQLDELSIHISETAIYLNESLGLNFDFSALNCEIFGTCFITAIKINDARLDSDESIINEFQIKIFKGHLNLAINKYLVENRIDTIRTSGASSRQQELDFDPKLMGSSEAIRACSNDDVNNTASYLKPNANSNSKES